MFTRFSVINDERKLILGLDKGGVFEPGVVYEAAEILDTIVLRKIGKARIDGLKGAGGMYADVNNMVYYGNAFLTEEEYQKALQHEQKI
jgi:hypothetical protein